MEEVVQEPESSTTCDEGENENCEEKAEEESCYDESGNFICDEEETVMPCTDGDDCTAGGITEEVLDEEVLSLLTDEDVTFTELADALTDLSPKMLNKALGLVLGIDNVEVALAEAEKSMEITDDTDFEKEAYFDINAFIAARGLFDTRGGKKSSGDTREGKNSSGPPPPDFVLQNQMKDVFALPEKYEM